MKFTKKELEAMLEEAKDEETVVETPVEETEVDVTEEVEKAFSKASSKVEKTLSTKLDSEVSKMKSDIEAWLEKQAELAKAQSGNKNPDIAQKHAKFNTYLKALSGALLTGDEAKLKEMTTDAEGSPFAGYAVDSELSAEIRHLTTTFGVARREFFATALSKNSYDANALATDVSVAWVSEAGVIPSTQIVLNQEELKLKKLAAIVSLTRELIEDQEVDLFSFIATRVAEGFAGAEDRAFFTGAGGSDTANGAYTGLLNQTLEEVEIAGDSVADITADSIYELADTLPEGAHAGAKFYMNRTILSVIKLIKDGDGRYIYQNPLDEKYGQGTLIGYPVVLVEAMPKASDVEEDDSFILFGDLKKTAILGYKSGIVADRFNAGVIRNVAGNGDINLITTDREAIRWISRVGFITILPEACVKGTLVAGSN
jgi:HK97 family phage major capsid protein